MVKILNLKKYTLREKRQPEAILIGSVRTRIIQEKMLPTIRGGGDKGKESL